MRAHKRAAGFYIRERLIDRWLLRAMYTTSRTVPFVIWRVIDAPGNVINEGAYVSDVLSRRGRCLVKSGAVAIRFVIVKMKPTAERSDKVYS